MTAEDWKKVERNLSPYTSVKFRIDGYIVDVAVTNEKPHSLKYVLAVYVNGSIKGEWLINDCDIRRRFYCKQTKSLLTAKDKSAPMFKRMKKADRENIIKKYQYDTYSPFFTSFRSLKNHFIRNNNLIELIEE